MGFWAFLILGLIAGVIARIVIPGKQPGGFWLIVILIVQAIFGRKKA